MGGVDKASPQSQLTVPLAGFGCSAARVCVRSGGDCGRRLVPVRLPGTCRGRGGRRVRLWPAPRQHPYDLLRGAELRRFDGQPHRGRRRAPVLLLRPRGRRLRREEGLGLAWCARLHMCRYSG